MANWKIIKFEGNGIYYYINRDKYYGEWKNGLKEGKRTFYFIDGSKYVVIGKMIKEKEKE